MIPAPSGPGCKPRLEYRIKRFNARFLYHWVFSHASRTRTRSSSLGTRSCTCILTDIEWRPVITVFEEVNTMQCIRRRPSLIWHLRSVRLGSRYSGREHVLPPKPRTNLHVQYLGIIREYVPLFPARCDPFTLRSIPTFLTVSLLSKDGTCVLSHVRSDLLNGETPDDMPHGTGHGTQVLGQVRRSHHVPDKAGQSQILTSRPFFSKWRKIWI